MLTYLFQCRCTLLDLLCSVWLYGLQQVTATKLDRLHAMQLKSASWHQFLPRHEGLSSFLCPHRAFRTPAAKCPDASQLTTAKQQHKPTTTHKTTQKTTTYRNSSPFCSRSIQRKYSSDERSICVWCINETTWDTCMHYLECRKSFCKKIMRKVSAYFHAKNILTVSSHIIIRVDLPGLVQKLI